MKVVFSVAEVAEKMGMSRQTVSAMFANERGVIIIEHHTPGKRPYRSMRIPAQVYERFLRRHTR